MKNIPLLILVGLMFVGMSLVMGEPQTIRGEVVDLACYTKDVLFGQQEKRNSVSVCVISGQPAGIVQLYKGDVYIIEDFDALPYMSKLVDVTGEVSSAGGSKTIKVKEIREINPSANNGTPNPAHQMEMYGY